MTPTTRPLEPGEIIQKGDEYQSIIPPHYWASAEHTIGDSVPVRGVSDYRRPCLSIGENRAFSLWLSDMNQVADVFPTLEDDVLWPSASWPKLINLHREDKTWRGLATYYSQLDKGLADEEPTEVPQSPYSESAAGSALFRPRK